ncbi:MAG TPA: methyltransferase domain-containing protein [Acidimicrobiales bacterium]|nr:methyltransferase domain-containing protein [Acidimicrobiales bacterium]
MSSSHHDGVNESERRRWNDEQWTETWPRREELTNAATGPLLDALLPQDGERILDVGSGAGATTLEVARRTAPSGLVVGADVSVALTAFARLRAADEQVANVRFLIADVQVDRVEGGLFDAAMSQFGVMFFDEPTTAFASIRENVVAEARFYFASWLAVRDNPWFLGPVLSEFVDPPPPPAPGKHTTGPFALADLDEVATLLAAAGWADVDCTEVRSRTTVSRDAIADDSQLRMVGINDEQFARARQLVDEYLSQFQVDDATYEVPTAFAIVSAMAPA